MSKVGTGYTNLPDPQAAAAQLVDMASAGIAGKPTLAILFATTDYDTAALVPAVQKKLGDTPIWGGSSSTGVFANDKWVTGEKGAACLMLLFDRPAGASVGEVEPDALAAGKAITSEAVKQAGGDASVLLTLGYMGPEEKVLEGATQVLPKAPVVGGTSSDHSAEGKFQQFGKGKTNKGSFAIAAIGGEVGYVFDHGYHLTGKKAKVTKCSGRRIIELDGRPALDVYAEWVGKPKAEVAGGVILVFSVNYPILLHREGYTLSVHPVGGNEDGSIDTGHAMEVGYVLELGEATTDALIDEVAVAVRAAAMKVKKPQAVLLSHCGGRAIALGDRVKEAAGKVKEAIGEVPWVGYLAFGEQGTPRPGEKEHANLSLSVLVLGE